MTNFGIAVIYTWLHHLHTYHELSQGHIPKHTIVKISTIEYTSSKKKRKRKK